VLQYHFNWKMLSAMAGVTWWNFYFRLFPGAIRSPQIILFLTHLMRHIPGKLLIVWDGLPAHRSRAVWEFIRQQRGRIWVEFLPAYAPELNPVEYLWSYWKQHELPNFCPWDFGQLSQHACSALRRMRRRPSLACAFWEQAGRLRDRQARRLIEPVSRKNPRLQLSSWLESGSSSIHRVFLWNPLLCPIELQLKDLLWNCLASGTEMWIWVESIALS
jgi:transposase